MKDTIAQLLKQIPGIKSQAQYDASGAAIASLCAMLEGLLSETPDPQARTALDHSLGLVERATDIYYKLAEAPEATTSSASEVFKQEPIQFTEEGTVDRLLVELGRFQDKATIQEWYQSAEVKEQIAKVVTQSTRNRLLDTIRAKLRSLTQVTLRGE